MVAFYDIQSEAVRSGLFFSYGPWTPGTGARTGLSRWGFFQTQRPCEIRRVTWGRSRAAWRRRNPWSRGCCRPSPCRTAVSGSCSRSSSTRPGTRTCRSLAAPFPRRPRSSWRTLTARPSTWTTTCARTSVSTTSAATSVQSTAAIPLHSISLSTHATRACPWFFTPKGRRWGSWGAAGKGQQPSECGGALWTTAAGFGTELRQLKCFSLFSPLRMAFPDTIILLIVDCNHWRAQNSSIPIPLRAPLARESRGGRVASPEVLWTVHVRTLSDSSQLNCPDELNWVGSGEQGLTRQNQLC